MSRDSGNSLNPDRRMPGLLILVILLIFFFTTLCSTVMTNQSQSLAAVLSTPSVLYLPVVIDGQSAATEWSQHAHDAQRTSYTDQIVPPPWRWKWAWNGPNASGGVSSGKTSLPRNVQPVTGAGRVYIAAGDRGVFALNNANGAQLWNATSIGSVNSTVAYDAETQSVFAVSTNGMLYKLNAASGAVLNHFSSGATSSLPLPPAVIGERVFFSMGSKVYAVNKATMQQIWMYNAEEVVETPPAYSASRDRVVVVTRDLYVHAINNANGSRLWRVKPTIRQGGDPINDETAEAKKGWPVIAERHGLALIKYRLDWQTLWTWTWPTNNSEIRANLTSRPDQQVLFALDLDDGSIPFIANLGHGGYGDGNYLPMGPQPVVKPLPDGGEVVWTVIRGGGLDGRWDSHMGEMVLDSTTVPGLQAGYVRWMEDVFTNNSIYFPTDEQPNVSVAGDFFFSGHWEAGAAFRVLDRSSNYGSYNNPIQTEVLPAIASSQDDPGCPFSSSHYCASGITNTRQYPPGFYIYYNQGNIYDQYWSEYAVWVVSNNTIYFRSCDGAIVALESGEPLAQSQPFSASPLADERNLTAASSETQSDVRLSEKVISAGQARQHVGEFLTVEFTVRHVINSRNKIIAAIENPHQGSFKAMILEKDWAKFAAAPEHIFPLNQLVRVRGKLTWYQGDAVIILSDPRNILVYPFDR